MIAGHRRATWGKIAILATSIAVLYAAPRKAEAQFEITTGVGNTSENFDSLTITTGSAQPWTNDTTLTPADSTLNGWSLFNFLNAPITTYNAGTGSSSAGSFYSFGATGVTERALGGVASGGTYFGSPASGAVAGYITFAATNTSAATLASFTLGFDGEQWRNGGNTTPQSMVLEYGFGSTFDTVTWTAPGGNFDWTSPVATGTAAAVDGNTTGLVAGRGGTIGGLNWTTGQTLWVRWIERNDAGNDHGLAIDNFAFSWTGAVIVSEYWDTNGSAAGIGGTGNWSTSSLTWNLQADGQGPTHPFDPNGRLIFGGTAGTVTIDPAGVTANGPLRFDTSNYVIAASGAGNLTLGTSATIEITDGVLNTNITAPISGTNGLIKTGGGPLQLSGVNDFSGEVSINNGALIFNQDIRLGNPNNPVVLKGGVLAPSATVALAATRNISGTGTIQVQIGQTLTFNGNANLGAIVLASNDAAHGSAGELNLSGASNSVGTLTFNDPVAVTAPNGVTLTGDVTMPNVANTVRVTGQVTLAGAGGVRKFTVIDTPQDVDFLFDGGVTGASRLHKVGDGTLELQGNNSAAFTGGVRLGSAGTTTEPGGRLIIDNQYDLGTGASQQIQFNDGRLHSLTNLTGDSALPVGVSLGAGQLGPAIFSGSPMEFTGVFQLFKPAGGSFQHRIQLDTDVTFSGAFDSGGATDTNPVGLLFTGAGSASFKALTNSVIDPLEVDGPTVSISGALSAATATLLVKSGKFTGNATLAGALTVGDANGNDDAFVSPGESIGTMSAASLFLDSDAVLKLEINSNLATPGADKLTIAGAVTLGGGTAKLDATDLGSTVLSTPLTLTIIENTSLDTTTGTFEGLPDGTQFLIGPNLFRIKYNVGPDLNDVALVLVPEPAAVTGLFVGVGLLGLRRRRSGAS
jgi:autotransporter-associated beta strand protein